MDLVSVLFVFFFKQKTAYEMRISDWSSDVCSSDLSASACVRAVIERAPFCQEAIDERLACKTAAASDSDSPHRRRHTTKSSFVHLQIGRASCRERVCQYV